MSKTKSGQQGKGQKAAKPVVVLAGEDSNDRTSMKHLLQKLCPHMRVVDIRDPVRLRAATPEGALRKRVQTLVRMARAKAVKERAELACVFVHEDFDELDGPEYEKTHARVEHELHKVLGHGHYVLAVEEMEAWMLLFPDALMAVEQSWELPKRLRGKDTGRIKGPKEALMNEVGGGRKKRRKYREADAPAVFKAIAEGGLEKALGSNRSWERFRADAHLCGSEHLGE